MSLNEKVNESARKCISKLDRLEVSLREGMKTPSNFHEKKFETRNKLKSGIMILAYLCINYLEDKKKNLVRDE